MIWSSALLSRLSFERNGHDAIWAPDGRTVVYAAAADRDTLIALYARRTDGSPELDTISSTPGLAAPEAVTPDGSQVLAYADRLSHRSRCLAYSSQGQASSSPEYSVPGKRSGSFPRRSLAGLGIERVGPGRDLPTTSRGRPQAPGLNRRRQ